MKNLLILLLLTYGTYAQERVFNVQQYCIDEMPLNKGECDITGTEYSFIFLDAKQNEVIFFLADMKFKYQIIDTAKDSTKTTYLLRNESGETQMTINNAKSKIEFLSLDRHIFFTVGPSTKSQ